MAIPPPPPLPMGGPPPPGVVVVENGRYYEEKPPNTPIIMFLNITNTITHLLIGGVAFTAIFFANADNFNITSNTFTLHIHLCVIGYILMMSQAVLAMSPHNGWTQNLKQENKKSIHLVMQIAGSILAIVGSVIRIADLDTHFNSTHAILGIIAMILTIFSLIGGVLNFFGSRLMPKPVFIKIFHSLIGSLTLIVAYLCLIFGFDSWIFRFNNEGNANLSISLAVFALVGTLLSSYVTMFKRILN